MMLESSRSRAFALALGACVLGAALPWLAARWARPAVLEFGPNDVGYTAGFREDWERERGGLTRFRWTTPHATVTLPIRMDGAGVVRARTRRHFIEPAELTVFAGRREIGRATVQAETQAPYRMWDPLESTCRHASLSIL